MMRPRHKHLYASAAAIFYPIEQGGPDVIEAICATVQDRGGRRVQHRYDTDHHPMPLLVVVEHGGNSETVWCAVRKPVLYLEGDGANQTGIEMCRAKNQAHVAWGTVPDHVHEYLGRLSGASEDTSAG